MKASARDRLRDLQTYAVAHRSTIVEGKVNWWVQFTDGQKLFFEPCVSSTDHLHRAIDFWNRRISDASC